MSTATRPSPLAVAALAFVGSGVTPTAMVERFAVVDALVTLETADALLDELTRLGLTRVVGSRNAESRYLLTPLGSRLLESSFVGRGEHADLLSELEQMRTDLLSTIAHELRTPLTAVRTSVGLLLDDAVEPTADERQSLLQAIDRNATRMQRVVGDILDLARFRAGRVQLQLRRFDAVELAQSGAASVSPLATMHRQRIDVDAPNGPVWLYGDYRRLEQALVNLLSNAAKYSPEGARIAVSVTTDRDVVRWAVTDEGPGISGADQSRLFERFFVAPGDRADATAGIGLGLPITLAIAQAHGGRVEVDSRPGRGSTFAVVVPVSGPPDTEHE